MAGCIGLIAGLGRLPEAIAKEAARRGERVVVVRGLPDATPGDEAFGDEAHDIFVGQWDSVVKALKHGGVERAYFVGKMPRERLFRPADFDDRFRRIFASIPLRSDDALTMAFVSDLEREGIVVGAQSEYLEHLKCPPGVFTRRTPTAQEWKDIARGFDVAKSIAGLDVGQAATTKDGAVVSVEAVEGTDASIRRAGQIAGPGCVVVKVAKPNQDARFDVPTVGMDTLEAVREAGVSVLALEANEVFWLTQDEMVAFADAHDIALVSYAKGMELQWPN